MPQKNNDPKMQMTIKNPAEDMQRKQSAISSENPYSNTSPEESSDPRLQIHFATKSEAMNPKSKNTNPILISEYQVASQSTQEDISATESKTIIDEQKPLSQPTNSYTSQTKTPPQTIVTESTKPLTLSKPTTPDVFES